MRELSTAIDVEVGKQHERAMLAGGSHRKDQFSATIGTML